MGVEYMHYFIVKDLSWVGTTADAIRIHELLSRWNLADDAPTVYDLDGRRPRKLRGALTNLKESPSNLGLVYPGVTGRETVEEIMGPSWHGDLDPLERYFQEILLLLGTDFRIHPSDETFYVESSDEDSGLERYQMSWPRWGSDEHFAGDAISPAPRAEVHAEGTLPVPPGFTGVWRAALRLDCGKDLPAFCGVKTEIPGSRFRRELETAFGTELVQIGFVY